MICRKACFKGWTHDEIVAGNVAEVEWKSTPETLHATLRTTVAEAATRCNYPIARNVACNVASCGRAFRILPLLLILRKLKLGFVVNI